jgi:hypothetical protein
VRASIKFEVAVPSSECTRICSDMHVRHQYSLNKIMKRTETKTKTETETNLINAVSK